MDKSKIESICERAGMKPAKRERWRDYEIFVADGFSLPPHRSFQRFGVDANDFPSGMYATLWWVSKKTEKLDTGQPIFFDAFHNPEYSLPNKKAARINTALREAEGFLKRRAANAN